jgi:hypothetical protein
MSESAALATDISISGQVRAYDQSPIQTIQVTVYRREKMLDRVYTDQDGRYQVTVPGGDPISVRFDTHTTITNAKEWHPSVIANLDARKNISLDRFLMRVGYVDSEEAAVDALAAYQFCAMWTDRERERDRVYAEYAAARLAMIKFKSEVLRDVQRTLEEHFRQRASVP